MGHEKKGTVVFVVKKLETVRAVICPCSCHPHPGVVDKHGEGGKCQCQFTTEERAEQRKKVIALFQELSEEGEKLFSEEKKEIFSIFTHEGAEIAEYLPTTPFVIAGTMKGCGFYVRERWDSWVLVAETYPWEGVDVWKNRNTANEVVADGVFSQNSYVELSREVVEHLKDYITRSTCTHIEGGRFCPDCGKKL